MSLAISTSEIALQSSSISTRTRDTWFEIRAQDLPLWNEILLGTNTSLYQYPFWNEPYRPLWVSPRYLAWGTKDQPRAYVCILTVGFWPVKVGLVFRGPTCLHPQANLEGSAITALLDWARAQGYMFIRFTHSDPEVMAHVALLTNARNVDAFPYLVDYPVVSPDFVVDQSASEEETLARFDREVRRKIRRATETGYEFRSDDSPEALEKLWPLYEECSRRKHFRLERPLSVYMQMMRLARPHNCARIYSVYFDGKAVGSTLVFRDGSSANCCLAAFDGAHRQSAVFLHWNSMRDMYRLGAHRYNLGPGPGSLARFKQQFSRRQARYPAPVTVVLKERWFRLWWKGLYPVAKLLRPALLRTVPHVHGRSLGKFFQRPARGLQSGMSKECQT
jgi:GNAT acetyltransferase-like protein